MMRCSLHPIGVAIVWMSSATVDTVFVVGAVDTVGGCTALSCSAKPANMRAWLIDTSHPCSR
jgi:hypothetical protein